MQLLSGLCKHTEDVVIAMMTMAGATGAPSGGDGGDGGDGKKGWWMKDVLSRLFRKKKKSKKSKKPGNANELDEEDDDYEAQHIYDTVYAPPPSRRMSTEDEVDDGMTERIAAGRRSLSSSRLPTAARTTATGPGDTRAHPPHGPPTVDHARMHLSLELNGNVNMPVLVPLQEFLTQRPNPNAHPLLNRHNGVTIVLLQPMDRSLFLHAPVVATLNGYRGLIVDDPLNQNFFQNWRQVAYYLRFFHDGTYGTF